MEVIKMCEYCLSSIHGSGCPNAPEPPAIYTCSCCNEGITVGDEYAEIEGEYYHSECLSCYTAKEILELVGIAVQEAQEEDVY
jgi:hypothetical protein